MILIKNTKSSRSWTKAQSLVLLMTILTILASNLSISNDRFQPLRAITAIEDSQYSIAPLFKTSVGKYSQVSILRPGLIIYIVSEVPLVLVL